MVSLGAEFYPGGLLWAIVIVTTSLATPVVLYFLGFRLKRQEEVSIGKRRALTIFIFVAWIAALVTSRGASNLGFLLLRWAFAPLILQYNVFMVVAWSLPFLLIFSGLLIPYWYCRQIVKYGVRYKIVHHRRKEIGEVTASDAEVIETEQ